MSQKNEFKESENNYNLFLENVINTLENAKLEANNAINSSINKVFFDNGINLRVSGEVATNPLTLKILGLKDEYLGKTKKEIFLMKIEEFLVNFKMKFTVVYRNKEFKIKENLHHVDLVLYHRRLCCLVIIDLKFTKLSQADIEQMLLYTSYANEHWREEGENPPVGLILCDENNEALAHYTLENLPDQILAKEYKMVLPSEEVLIEEIKQLRRLLEGV